MIQIILLSLFLLGTQALPFPEDLQVRSDGLGNYQYQSVDEAGTRLSESGQIVDIKGKPVDVKQGDFAYVAPDTKQPISLTWRADEKGFKPYGAHLPTPPPIPVEIATSLAAKNVPPPFGPGSPNARSLSYFGMAMPMLYY